MRLVAKHLDMLKYFGEMRTRGYCVLPPTKERLALVDTIRSDVIRISNEQLKNKEPIGGSTPRYYILVNAMIKVNCNAGYLDTKK